MNINTNDDQCTPIVSSWHSAPVVLALSMKAERTVSIASELMMGINIRNAIMVSRPKYCALGQIFPSTPSQLIYITVKNRHPPAVNFSSNARNETYYIISVPLRFRVRSIMHSHLFWDICRQLCECRTYRWCTCILRGQEQVVRA